jgi:hypothetical protein
MAVSIARTSRALFTAEVAEDAEDYKNRTQELVVVFLCILRVLCGSNVFP